jgi:peptide deformylase|tara:strand:+ start:39 stop:569 length:531 start_codon:yes stop_codon:yes gene_type:complete
MSILKIAQLGHPTLYKKASLVDNITEPSIKKLIHDMSETMIDYKGIGLAAPQVHISKQVIIFRTIEDQAKESNEIKITALINPRITKTSEETDNQWEGCLSIPGMLGLVKRHSGISYEGFDMSGNKVQQNAEGLHARVVQHECDHLNGIVFIHRLVDKKAYGYEGEIEEYWKKKHD